MSNSAQMVGGDLSLNVNFVHKVNHISKFARQQCASALHGNPMCTLFAWIDGMQYEIYNDSH